MMHWDCDVCGQRGEFDEGPEGEPRDTESDIQWMLRLNAFARKEHDAKSPECQKLKKQKYKPNEAIPALNWSRHR